MITFFGSIHKSIHFLKVYNFGCIKYTKNILKLIYIIVFKVLQNYNNSSVNEIESYLYISLQ